MKQIHVGHIGRLCDYGKLTMQNDDQNTVICTTKNRSPDSAELNSINRQCLFHFQEI